MEFRSLRPEEMDLFYDHCDICHVKTPRQYFVDNCLQDPAFDPADILAAMDGKALAATVRLIPRRVYVKGRAVTMGGIGDVGTKPEYRKQGLSGRLLQMAIERMEQKDMPLSILFTGVNGHYQRYGWATLPGRRVTLEAPQAQLPQGVSARFFRPEDFAAMRGLYDLYAPKYGGALVRDSAAYWDSWVRAHMRNAHVLEADGRVQAYAATGNVRADAPGGATFDLEEWIAAPEMEPLLPAFLSEIRRIGSLPARVRFLAPLWPQAEGEQERTGDFMVRLNGPIMLDVPIRTNEELAQALGEPLMFAADHY